MKKEIEEKIKELEREMNELEALAVSERKAHNYGEANFIDGEKQITIEFYEFLKDLLKASERK